MFIGRAARAQWLCCALVHRTPQSQATAVRMVQLSLQLRQIHRTSALERSGDKIPRHSNIIIVDEKTNSKSTMIYSEALKLAQREKMILVQKEGDQFDPHFTFVRDETTNVVKNTRNKKLKTITIKSTIAVPDLKRKVDHMADIVTLGHNVKVIIERIPSDMNKVNTCIAIGASWLNIVVDLR